jgi:hypothetical protein
MKFEALREAIREPGTILVLYIAKWRERVILGE